MLLEGLLRAASGCHRHCSVLLRAVFDCDGSVVGSLGALLAPSMVSAILHALALSCGSFGHSRRHPRADWEPSWACLGLVLDHLVPVLWCFRAVSGLSQAMLALSQCCVGPSWHPFGPAAQHLEPSWLGF